MKTADQIAVMQAEVEEKPIRFRRKGTEDWHIGEAGCMAWNWEDYDYEVVPEPAVPRTFNVWLCGSGQLYERSEDQPAADWVESGFRATTITEIPPGWKLVPPDLAERLCKLLPGGDTCDPQQVADSIREFFGEPLPPVADFAGRLADFLLTDGGGEKGVRLAIITSNGRELGGWGRDALVKHITALHAANFGEVGR